MWVMWMASKEAKLEQICMYFPHTEVAVLTEGSWWLARLERRWGLEDIQESHGKHFIAPCESQCLDLSPRAHLAPVREAAMTKSRLPGKAAKSLTLFPNPSFPLRHNRGVPRRGIPRSPPHTMVHFRPLEPQTWQTQRKRKALKGKWNWQIFNIQKWSQGIIPKCP